MIDYVKLDVYQSFNTILDVSRCVPMDTTLIQQVIALFHLHAMHQIYMHKIEQLNACQFVQVDRLLILILNFVSLYVQMVGMET